MHLQSSATGASLRNLAQSPVTESPCPAFPTNLLEVFTSLIARLLKQRSRQHALEAEATRQDQLIQADLPAGHCDSQLVVKLSNHLECRTMLSSTRALCLDPPMYQLHGASLKHVRQLTDVFGAAWTAQPSGRRWASRSARRADATC